MKKVAMTVVGVLALATAANADPPLGTWYTDYATWQSLVSNVSTASYTTVPNGSSPWTEAGVTAAATSGSWFTSPATTGALSTETLTPVTFTFAGNSFGSFVAMTASSKFGRAFASGAMNFSIDGSLTNTQILTTSTSNYTFLGYISNSASPISVTASNAFNQVTVDSFSFGQSTSSLGGNVAPEPGTLALALTGGCALIGMVIRRRRISN